MLINVNKNYFSHELMHENSICDVLKGWIQAGGGGFRGFEPPYLSIVFYVRYTMAEERMSDLLVITMFSILS